MKQLSAIIAIIMCSCFGTVYADPRMEVNDTFNHVILETDDTNDEVFVANADPNIVVQSGKAWGFVDNMIKNPKLKDVFKPGVTKFSSESGGVCNMVDSNGTQYVSKDWVQIVRRNDQHHPNIIYYRLECRNGQKK